ncbi:MAG: protein kinase, partial [Planctomycetes bacterium]|nr:protein kinase [Planctomycetota bacterium]
MTWQRVRQEFEALCELPDDAVAARLATLQTTDAWLAEQVRGLLQQDRGRPAFLDRATGPLAPTPAAAVGVRLGRFELVRPLGSGGMGSVWEARQSAPDRRVAIKLVAWSGRVDEQRWRFRHEVQALAQLSHPAIAALYEAGESELGGSTVAWFAMELVDGAADLLEWARRRELSRRERV